MRLEHCAHEDGGPAPPYTGLDEVARDLVLEDALDAILDVVHASEPDHGLGPSRTVEAVFARRRVVRE